MGIKDLLKFMKQHVEPIHINKYAGKRVGIDAYSWLHKGAYSCSMELCLNMEGEKKYQYLKYFMHRINLLRHHNVTPVVVFDGQNIPCKATTEQDRSRRRKENRGLAMAKLKEGNVNAATELFQRAVSISPSIAHQLIQILKSEDIEFVVAPYEADAQLAFLASLEAEKGGIDGVISEDSDLLAYGCPSIIFKMDRFGNGEEIVLSKVFESVDQVPSFRNLNMELFTGMCVLAGCDFLPSVPGIGIVKAFSLVSKYRSLDRALSMLKFEKGSVMPEDYTKSFREALAVFQHALVYDANSKSLKHLKPLSEKFLNYVDGDHDFLGPDIPQSIAIAIAEGNLDPSTMKAFDHFPSSKVHLKSSTTINQISYKPPRIDTTTVSEEVSCFTVVSSHRTNSEKTASMSAKKQKPSKKEPNFTNEMVELEKLVCPFNTPIEENKTCKEKVVLKTPENNPFKKRKTQLFDFSETKQMPLEEEAKFSKEMEVLAKLVCPFNTPTEENKTYIKRVALKKPENNQFKKRKVDQTEILIEQVSVLTEVDDLDILCETPESQKSVNSKQVDKAKAAKEEKSNDNNLQKKENDKCSILNFFRRV